MFRDKLGRFKRKHIAWSLENFNDGYIDTKNRFRVYYPNHNRADKRGYVFRAIIAYEIYHHDFVRKGFVVHHNDGNTLNDSKENLHKLSYGEHLKNHRPKLMIKRICRFCKKKFKIPNWKSDLARRGRGNYCSIICSYKARRNRRIINCLFCDKPIETIPCRIKNGRKFCSYECFVKYRKEKANG